MKFEKGDIVYRKGAKKTARYNVVDVREYPYSVTVRYRGALGKEKTYSGRDAERMFVKHAPDA